MGHQDDTGGSAGSSRRQFLARAGAVGLAGAAAPLLGGTAAEAATQAAARLASPAAATPIKNIVVCCQENRSFDSYYGKYSKLPAGFGIPADYSNPTGNGGKIKPWHFTTLTGNGANPYHDWSDIHTEYAGGKMNGFYKANGRGALGYFEASQLAYYYSLVSKYTLCANYFCGALTDTSPNRLVLYSGTSGGLTSDIFTVGSLDYPCILDLLSEHGKSFKNYNFHCPDNYSNLAMFKKWSTGGPNNELNRTIAEFMSDCKNGSLADVSFITEAPPYDEHPVENIHTGMDMIESIVKAVQAGPQWAHTAILITYDEAGGFFDHIAPKQIDAYGLGMRVPMLVVSPYAKKGHVDTTLNGHASVLKFIEHVFGLPTLASVNTKFNKSTPSANNATGGKPFPPQDGNKALGNLTTCFTFG